MKKWVLLLFLLALVGCHTPKEQPQIVEYQVEFVSNSEEVFTSIRIQKDVLLDASNLPVPTEVEGFTFDGWYLDEAFVEKAEGYVVSKELKLYGKWVEVLPKEEELALEGLVLVLSTHVDVTLPQKAGEFDLVWYSSNKDVLTSLGKVARVSESVVVEMKAMILTDDIYEKVFLVTVEKYPYEEKFNEAIATIQFPEFIVSNVNLNTRFEGDIRGTWTSDKPTIISSVGQVSLVREIVEVTLTLTLKLDEQEATFTFVVQTKARDLSVQDPEYFMNQLTKKGVDVDLPIMTDLEIASFNQTVVDTLATNTIHLTVHPVTLSRNEVQSKIEKYSNINRYTVYNYETHRALSSADKNAILSNRNLEAIPTTVEVSYAVSVKHTVLRSYPTHHYSSTNSMDRFQETGFSLGTPMVILHTSLDQKWYYVRMFHYDGWVPADSVGVCSREEFLEFVSPERFVVVLDKFLSLEGESVRMGNRLPYMEKVADQYKLMFPTRTTNGQLLIQEVLLDASADVSDGYIPYTYANLLTQAYKFIGTVYSWGDKLLDGLDCSSTQAAIYGTFGFVMGRNTSNQRVTNIYGGTVSGLTNELLKSYPVGTLLYTSSHVLMYIGADDAGNAWLLHNTSTGNVCKLQTLNSYGTTGISWTLGMYK